MTHPPVALTLIGLEACDTLRHDEPLFRLTRAGFDSLLQRWADSDTMAAPPAQAAVR